MNRHVEAFWTIQGDLFNSLSVSQSSKLGREDAMSDGHEEREEQEKRRELERREDREDRIDRDLVDKWEPERDDS
jgi:hypothetical protein